ncbi:DUF1631 domain-containing protein [Cellvibrio sp. KB43]|uniref:DUF1631 domain-containing protein n=1 Tax=Cellvibrio polysaccharolyticus TaxID=2082724 RepID=A0A928V761_9GAMM|nr:DUF1631 domain-containing protein [Cellvibrio polysaccharolyticus]
MSEHLKPESTNVVPLNPERSAAGYIPLARLPSPLQSLREQARQQLQTLLRELFDRADDALFDLADKAGNNQEQNLYFDSMREVRIRRRAIEASFFKAFDSNLLLLVEVDAHRSKAEASRSVSLDELSLVQNDELEEMVAVDGMINKSTERFADLLQPLTLRIDHLVPVKVYQKNNPVAPFPICHSFSEAIRPVRMDVKARLLLFKLFDQMVLGKLAGLYQRLNQLLIDANILPTLPSQNRGKPAGLRAGSGNTSGGENSYSGTGSSLDADHAGEVLQTLRALLGSRQQSISAPLTHDQPVLDSAGLIHLLSSAQQTAWSDVALTSPQQHAVDLRQVIQQYSARQGMPAAINPVDDDVINLVGMMFEFILEDRNLAAPMKALIGRLQIPMVKVAIADKSFFSKGGHPARRLLNEMASAALGWQEEAEDNRRGDNLFQRMETMVADILTGFESDVEIFSRMLADFRAWLDKERRRAQILEQRTLDAEDGKAKAEQARAEVNRALGLIVGERPLPEAGLAILQNAWANVMFITALKHGTSSEQWQSVSKTAELLVWSLTAAMSADSRRQLLKVVPQLLQQLRKGLESIAFNPFETTHLFKQLEVLHLARLKPPAAPEAGAVSASIATKDSVVPVSSSSAEQEPEAVAKDAAPSSVETASTIDAGLIEPGADETSVSLDVETVEPLLNSAPTLLAGESVLTAPQDELSPSLVTAEQGAETPGDEVLPDSDPHYRLVNNLTQGCWFEMTDVSGQKFRCRLAAIIRATGKYIFVNRSGMKVAEETRNSLALSLKNGRLLLLDDSMLFDRALEAVIGSLREQRGS